MSDDNSSPTKKIATDGASGKKRDRSPYNLRPRRNVDYRETKRGQTSNASDDPAPRGRRRQPAAASRRGSRSRRGTPKRSAPAKAKPSASRSRSRSDILASGSGLDGLDDGMDVDPDFECQETALASVSQSGVFTAADKDFYPINLSDEEVLESLKNNGRSASCCSLTGSGACTFLDIGGLGPTIDAVKKTFRLPLLCPEFYEEFKIKPKKGLIFYGPPGVGKTMTARALVDACKCYTNQTVAFFMRKGSDLLNPYLGQSEANLGKLFDAAKKLSPSIIFLDEFDALGRCRTTNSNHTCETNVVSTLLALMDGLDDRGLVFIIAATNRLSALDPAFRRAGRFDVEICFKMPDLKARRDIMSKGTSTWTMNSSILDTVAADTDGYNGADLSAICEEAALNALERENPDLADCDDNDFPSVRVRGIEVLLEDFEAALEKVQASKERQQDQQGS